MAGLYGSTDEFGDAIGKAFCCGFIIAFIFFAMAVNKQKEDAKKQESKPTTSWFSE